jgi:hypothetical protein
MWKMTKAIFMVIGFIIINVLFFSLSLRSEVEPEFSIVQSDILRVPIKPFFNFQGSYKFTLFAKMHPYNDHLSIFKMKIYIYI